MTTLEENIKNIKLLQVFQNQKEELKIKTQQDLIISYNQGLFYIDSNLISTIKTMKEFEYEEFVLPDKNFNPIKISNISDFEEEVISKYTEVMNEYFIEYEKLKKTRKVIKIMETDDE